MRDETSTVPARSPARAAKSGQWVVLVVASVLFTATMVLAGLPGAWLLGPMVAGIVVGINGGSVRVPQSLLVAAQALVGCMVAGLVTRPVLASFARQWPIFVAVTVSTLLASTLVGWVLNRRKVLPGTTAIWGISPGAASVMMLMAESHGDDARLVAFMQYLRVLCVAFLASIVARFWISGTGVVRPDPAYGRALHVVPFAETLAVAGLGVVLARWVRIPSGILIVPMVLGSILHASGIIAIELPRWLLMSTFAVLGCSVGLQFTRTALAHAARSFPSILAAILALIGFCGAVALVLHRVVGTELLTAYLATSPGGVDAAAVIAASTKVDMPFVMGLQTMRLVVVLLLGPSLARFVASRSAVDRVIS